MLIRIIPLAGNVSTIGAPICSANASKDSLACFVPFPAKITGFFASFIASFAASKSSFVETTQAK